MAVMLRVLPEVQVKDEELSVSEPALELLDLELQLSNHATSAWREQPTGTYLTRTYLHVLSKALLQTHISIYKPTRTQ